MGDGGVASAAIAAMKAQTSDVKKEYSQTLERPYVHDDGTVDFLALSRRTPCDRCVTQMPSSPISAYQPINWVEVLKSKRAYNFTVNDAALLAAYGYEESGLNAKYVPDKGHLKIRYEGCSKPMRGLKTFKEQDLPTVLLDLLKCKCDIQNRWTGANEYIIFCKNMGGTFSSVNNRVIRLHTHFSCQKCANNAVVYDIIAFAMNGGDVNEVFCLDIKVVVDFSCTFLTLGKKKQICC